MRLGGSSALIGSLLLALLATAAFIGFAWAIRRLRRWCAASLVRLAQHHAARVVPGGVSFFNRERLYASARAVTSVLYWTAMVLVATEWLGFVLRQFEATRAWGDGLQQSLLDVLGEVFGSIGAALPGLAVVAVIVVLARIVLALTRPFFDQVESGRLAWPWLDIYTVAPTRRLVHVIVWLFALAMAYPYLPGAQTEAFKGLSVLIGLMLSLGASGIVGQAASGIILTYSRTLRVGEYVRVGDCEGTVTELGTFAARIHTGMGEEVTLPNALIVGAVTKNYSRPTGGAGFVIGTSVTIGYDAPWRQVHAMLIEAATMTEGIANTPPPQVYQTALSDFYVEYRLVARSQLNEPQRRAEMLSRLNANVQDVFNRHGVQIMSPHYFSDPAQPKVVAPADWHPTGQR